MDKVDEETPFLSSVSVQRLKVYTLITCVCGLVGLAMSGLSFYYVARASDIDQLTFVFGKTTYGTAYLWFACALLVLGLLCFVVAFLGQKGRLQRYLSFANITSALSPVVLSAVVLAAITVPHKTTWGPIQIPFGSGTKIVWWTEKPEQSKVCIDGKLYYSDGYREQTMHQQGCDTEVASIKTQFHAVLIESSKFSYELFGYQHHVDNTGRDEVRFLLVTDMHHNEKFMRKATQDAYDFDFVVSAGDMTTNSSLKQLYSLYRDFKARNYVQTMGNHEIVGIHNNIFTRDSLNYHQEINGHHFFFLNVFDQSGQPSDEHIKRAIEWLDQELELYQGNKFIITHYPIYSTGEFGSIPQYTTELERVIDAHFNSYILGVFSGHSHLFNAFRRNYTQFIVAGNGGGVPDLINDSSIMGNRVWNASHLMGPMSDDNDKRLGYQHHLNSWLENTRTEVSLTAKDIKYTVRSLKTWKILASYQYDIDHLRYWGPIVTPKDSGANLTWWTNAKLKTQVCVDGVLYYGTDNLTDTQTHVGCNYDPPVKGSNFHQVFVDKLQFDAKIEDKEIHFDNTPQAAHRFIITSDAHEDAPIIAQSIQDIDQFDFHISGGDTTYYQMSIEYQAGFLNWHQKPYLQAVGNHESYTRLRQFGQQVYNYHQNIQGVNFYFLFIFNSSDIAAVSDLQIEVAMSWLEKEIDLHQGPKFIVTHYPIYSTGEFGSYPLFTNRMEAFLQAHTNSNILAIVSGHEHIFSSFRREGILYLIAASNGGILSRIQSVDVMGDRIWMTPSLHGPLDGNGNEKNMGFEYHLDSWHKFTRTEVTMENGLVKYTVRDLQDWAVLAEYEQQYKE